MHDKDSDDEKSILTDEEEKIEENIVEESAAEVEELEPVKSGDTFALHFDFDLPLEKVDNLWSQQTHIEKTILTWPQLGILRTQKPQLQCQDEAVNSLDLSKGVKRLNADSLRTMGIRATIVDNLSKEVTPLQLEVFQILNHYHDFCYPSVSKDKVNELRFCYTAHVLNHMLKTRNRILKHNMKLTSTPNLITIPDSYRDQGLARPKVLIILPFRKCAYQTVTNMGRLLYGKHVGR